MNAISYNLRGCGCHIKRKCFSKLIRKEKFDFCLIQETKVKRLEEKLVFELWDGFRC